MATLNDRINNDNLKDDERFAAPPKRVMSMFYLIDNSGSMAGEKIETVNSSLEEIMGLLDDISASNDDAEIKVAAMSFDTEPVWRTNGVVAPSEFSPNLDTNRGLTNLGKALNELNSKLSKTHGFMTQHQYKPVIILLSDGSPTDNYKEALEKLRKENRWFGNALKFAFAIGKDAKREVLAEFTGSDETVIDVNNAPKLKEYLKEVSVIASEFNSRSASAGDTRSPEETSKELAEEAKSKYNRKKDPDVPPVPDTNPWSEW